VNSRGEFQSGCAKWRPEPGKRKGAKAIFATMDREPHQAQRWGKLKWGLVKKRKSQVVGGGGKNDVGRKTYHKTTRGTGESGGHAGRKLLWCAISMVAGLGKAAGPW